MANIDSIGAGIYSTVAYFEGSTLPTAYSTDSFIEIPKVREIPSFGTPANIVNVPTYGSPVSSQIQGQSDAPTLDILLNYVPADHSTLEGLVNNGKSYIFRFRLANSELPNTLLTTTKFNDFYVIGKIAALSISPNLTDSTQASLTLTTTSAYSGPFTLTA